MCAPKMGDDRENGDREGEKRGRLIFNQGLGSTTPFAAIFCREDMGMKLGYRACSVRIRKKGGKRSVVTFFLLLLGQVEEEEEEAGLGFPSPCPSFFLFGHCQGRRRRSKKGRRMERRGRRRRRRWCLLAGDQAKKGGGGATGENKKKKRRHGCHSRL